MVKLIVRVLSVSPLLDVRNNQTMHQVTFGEMVDVTPEIRDRLLEMKQPAPPARIAINILNINFLFEDTVPYMVGSRWEIYVNDENGELSMKKVSKNES